MSSSRTSQSRIFRSSDGSSLPAASILVEPAGTRGASGTAEMIDRARQEGREEGYRAATEEMGAAEAAGRAAQLRRLTDALVSAAEDVAEARREAVAVAAGEAAGLAYYLAEAFLQRELHIGRPALEAVERALGLAPEGHDLIVRLNPADNVALDELSKLLPDIEIQLLADPRIEAGGCVVQAGPSRIDTQLGAALERVRALLDELFPESPSVLSVVGRAKAEVA